jgi:integrase
MNRRFPISDRSNGRNEIGELINFGQTADGRASSMGWRLCRSNFNESSRWTLKCGSIRRLDNKRRASGYALANAGHDTRALQAWLGHKNIQHTVRYTELAPDRFNDFWRD